MGKVKSQLRFGLWPDSSTPANHPAELTVAARCVAASALEELNRLSVAVTLDGSRKGAHATRIPPPAARLMIERQGDPDRNLSDRAGERGA